MFRFNNKHYKIHTIIPISFLILWLVGCTNTTQTTTPFYYSLSERRLEIVEFDPATEAITRKFPLILPNLDSKGPEGITFVPNQAIKELGLLGLDESLHGGYFIVSVQKKGQIFVIDIPLTEDEPMATQPILTLEVPGLGRDASALFYSTGILWVMTAKDMTLFEINITNVPIEVIATHDLSELALHDPEGFAQNGSITYFADDAEQFVVGYADFPACLISQACQVAWGYEFDDMEPSGLAWDTTHEQLIMVDDQGRLVTIPIDKSDYKVLLHTDDDWEGVTMVHRTETAYSLPLIGPYSVEYTYH